MKPSPRQIQACRDSDKRINIWTGAVRSGKTYGLFWKFNQYAQHGPAGKLAIVAKTLETLRENILEPMQELMGPEFSYSDSGRRINLAGRKIRGVGANDEKSKGRIQGDTLAGVMGDEVTLWPESFFKMLMSRLSVTGAQAFFSCNPESPYHWLKKGWIDRQADLSLSYHHFKLEDNATLDLEYIENLKKEYTGLWYKRYIEGLWVLAEGVIYDMFNEKQHCMDIYAGDWPTIISIDYGIANPTVFLKIGVPDNRAFVISEYYYDYAKTNKQKTDSELADDFDIFCRGFNPFAVYIDPSALSFITELKRRGYNVKSADNDVINGIAFCSKKFNKNELFISRQCKNLIQELGTYSWDEKAQMKGDDKPLKKNDHACDAMRYGIYSHFNRGQVFVG